MNLEGNNLTTIDHIVPDAFPKLTSLAVSKNQFDCVYLERYLHRWDKVETVPFIKNPTDFQTEINGIDCFQRFPIDNKTDE